MKKIILTLVIILAVLPLARAQQDFDSAFDEMDKAFDESALQEEEAWDQVDAALEGEWEAEVKQAEEQWEKLRAEVEQKWDEFYYSTNKEWVDYDENKNTRSRVNFEVGEIEISVVVPLKEKPPAKKIREAPEETAAAETAVPAEKILAQVKPEEKKQIIAVAEKKIGQQVAKIFSRGNQVNKEVLKDQVLNGYKQAVTPENVKDYVTRDLSPKIKLDKKVIKSKDGNDRLKFTVKIKMVPKHLEVRASKFKTQVKKYADKYKLDPALVFAVIHTESYFNPLAKSRIPAYGLMQLVPRFAALEAYQFLNGEKKLLPADYLYDPENNITLGSTYLHLLHERYFRKITDPDNRQSISIAAYNCGPTRMNRTLVKKYDVNGMQNRELDELINKIVPGETKEYIKRVKKRIPLYRGMI